MARVWTIVAVFAACIFAGCDPCEDEACEAAKTPHPHAQISQGIVGVVADVPTDNCGDTCCACVYSDTEIRVTEATKRVTRRNAASIAAQGKSITTIHAHHDYAQVLDPGDYLLCLDGGGKGSDGDSCAGLHIAAGDLFTVNVDQGPAGQSFTVFDADDEGPRDDLVFTLPTQ